MKPHQDKWFSINLLQVYRRYNFRNTNTIVKIEFLVFNMIQGTLVTLNFLQLLMPVLIINTNHNYLNRQVFLLVILWDKFQEIIYVNKDKNKYKDNLVNIQKIYNKDKKYYCMIKNNNNTNIHKSVVYKMTINFKHKIV